MQNQSINMKNINSEIQMVSLSYTLVVIIILSNLILQKKYQEELKFISTLLDYMKVLLIVQLVQKILQDNKYVA